MTYNSVDYDFILPSYLSNSTQKYQKSSNNYMNLGDVGLSIIFTNILNIQWSSAKAGRDRLIRPPNIPASLNAIMTVYS